MFYCMLCILINEFEYSFWIINKNGSSTNKVYVKYDYLKSAAELNADLFNLLRFIPDKNLILQVVVVCQIERIKSIIERFVQEYFKTYPLFLDQHILIDRNAINFKVPIENTIMSYAVQKEYKKSDYIIISSGYYITSIAVIVDKKVIDMVFFDDFRDTSDSINKKYRIIPDFSNIQSVIKEPITSFNDALTAGLFLSRVGAIDKVIEYFKTKYEKIFFVIASQAEDDKFLEYCSGVNQIDGDLLNKGILNLV